MRLDICLKLPTVLEENSAALLIKLQFISSQSLNVEQDSPSLPSPAALISLTL